MENSPPTSSSSGWLSYPRALWVSLAIALGLGLLALRASFMADEFIFLGILGQVPQPAPLGTSALDLYNLIPGDPAVMQPLIQKGVYPWWTLPDLKISFWRPLSSAILLVEHKFFGNQPMGYHAHSALWYVALVALTGAMLRRVLPAAVAAIALVLFALDDSHATSVAWLANRSTIISMCFGLVSVCLHLEWRQRGRTWALPLSVLSLVMGLAAAETALLVIGYLLAYEWLGAEGPLSTRLKAMAPTALVLIVYSVAHTALGYGAAGSDMHIDPLAQPLFWLQTALLWVPINLAGLFLNAPIDMFIDAKNELPLAIAGLVGLGLVGLMLRASWSGLNEPERRQLRWLLAGFAISVVAAATTGPSVRILLVPSLGAAIILAVVVHHAWRRRERNWRGWALVVGAGAMVLFHAVLAPLSWWTTVDLLRNFSASNDRVQQQYTALLDQESLPHQRVVQINVPNASMGVYASILWWATGKVLPQSWWVLSYDAHEQRITRTGPSTLEIEPQGGRFFSSVVERIHRSKRYPLPVGHEVKLDGMTVKVLEVDSEGVRKLSFTFDVPLEDPSLVLLHWKNRKVHRFVPPPLGNPVSLNALAIE